GPPYHAIDIDRSTDAVLTIGDGIGQQSLSVTGLWGHTDIERTLSTWTLGSSPNTSTTSVTINAPVGVGSLVRVCTERIIVSYFFQAEDGIRDLIVTGVQTCALPI